MADAFILGGVRTPVGRYGGALSHIRTDDLLGRTMVARDTARAMSQGERGGRACRHRGPDATRLDAALPFFDADISLEAAEDEPDAGTYRGHAGMRVFIGGWIEAFSELHFEVQEFIDAGDAVVVPYRLRARGRNTGLEITGHETWVVWVRGGQVAQVQEFRETADALDAVGLRE